MCRRSLRRHRVIAVNDYADSRFSQIYSRKRKFLRHSFCLFIWEPGRDFEKKDRTSRGTVLLMRVVFDIYFCLIKNPKFHRLTKFYKIAKLFNNIQAFDQREFDIFLFVYCLDYIFKVITCNKRSNIS